MNLNEFNKELNAKIYYKPDEKVLALKEDKNTSYKIKELYSDKFYKERLLRLFKSIITSEFIKIKVEEYLTTNYNKSDTTIYNDLYLMTKSNIIASNVLDADIEKYIDLSLLNISVNKCLDIGCKDIGKYFNLGYTDSVNIVSNDILSFKSNTFDLVNALMVLHHVLPEKLDIVLDEITRVIKKGGILLLGEYTLNPLIRLNTHLLDIMHFYYDTISGILPDKSIMNYNMESYWNRKLTMRGFERHASNIDQISNEFDEYKKNTIDQMIIAYVKI